MSTKPASVEETERANRIRGGCIPCPVSDLGCKQRYCTDLTCRTVDAALLYQFLAAAKRVHTLHVARHTRMEWNNTYVRCPLINTLDTTPE